MTKDMDKLEELDWLDWKDLNYPEMETFLEKAKRKTKENPLVPIGTLATASALTYGLYSFYKGDKMMSQYMMRTRVGAQLFTISAIYVGYLFFNKKENSGEQAQSSK